MRYGTSREQMLTCSSPTRLSRMIRASKKQPDWSPWPLWTQLRQKICRGGRSYDTFTRGQWVSIIVRQYSSFPLSRKVIKKGPLTGITSSRGRSSTAQNFSFTDLAALPEQVADVGQLVPGREGGARPLKQQFSQKGRSLLTATYVLSKSS